MGPECQPLGIRNMRYLDYFLPVILPFFFYTFRWTYLTCYCRGTLQDVGSICHTLNYAVAIEKYKKTILDWGLKHKTSLLFKLTEKVPCHCAKYMNSISSDRYNIL